MRQQVSERTSVDTPETLDGDHTSVKPPEALESERTSVDTPETLNLDHTSVEPPEALESERTSVDSPVWAQLIPLCVTFHLPLKVGHQPQGLCRVLLEPHSH